MNGYDMTSSGYYGCLYTLLCNLLVGPRSGWIFHLISPEVVKVILVNITLAIVFSYDEEKRTKVSEYSIIRKMDEWGTVQTGNSSNSRATTTNNQNNMTQRNKSQQNNCTKSNRSSRPNPFEYFPFV